MGVGLWTPIAACVHGAVPLDTSDTKLGEVFREQWTEAGGASAKEESVSSAKLSLSCRVRET